MRYAVIHRPTCTVVNVIVFTQQQGPWSPPQDHFIIKSNSADIGDYYDEKQELFTKITAISDQE